jgi:hypothetical protein
VNESDFKTSMRLLIMVETSVIFFLSCGDKGTNVESNIPTFRYNDYEITNNLDWSQRWYTWQAPLDYVNGFPHDRNGIVLGFYGGQYFYNPFIIEDHGIYYLNSYRQTQDSAYLHIVYRYADKLLEIGDRIHGGIYMPYSVSTPIHGSNDIMFTPSYSGFAQGFALSFFSRIYELTGDSHMRAVADSVFETMLFTDSSDEAWTSVIDSAGYFWIEEYPTKPFEHVLNGFMFGIFGLHDYYMITQDQDCAQLIKGSCTTIAQYFDQWRNPGAVCCYCLKHRHVDPAYHILVTQQLRQIALISGDSAFSCFADTLYSDYH